MKAQLHRRFIISIALALAAAFAAIRFHNLGAHTAEESGSVTPVVPVRLATVVERPMQEVLSATGRVEPLPGQETALCPASDGIVTAVYVKEGDWVTAGQPVVQLNSALQAAAVQQSAAQLSEARAATAQSHLHVSTTATDVNAEVAAADSALRTAKLQLTQAQQEANAQPNISSSSVERAKADLHSAQQELARTRAGARPEEIKQAEAAVNRAAALMHAAKRDMDRTARLVQAGVKPGKDLQDAETTYATAQADHSAALDALKLLQKGARSEDLRIAEAKVAGAEAALKSAEADQVQVRLKTGAVGIARQQVTAAKEALQAARSHRARVEVERQGAAQAQARESAARGALQSSQVQRQRTVVKAPISGCVVARMIDPGEAATPATPLLKIANLNAVRVVINVPTDSLSKVRSGVGESRPTDPSDWVRVDILAGNRRVVATGTVVTIGKTADPGNNTVPVWAIVANQTAKLSAGQFVDAQIVTTRKPTTIAVPVAAVLPKGGGSVLFVVDGNNVAHQRTVELGLQGGGFVEIRRGVKSGDVVVTQGNYELSDGMKVKPLDTSAKGD